MNQLLDKYKSGRLSHEELELLRRRIDVEGDGFVIADMESSWSSEAADADGVFSNDDVMHIKDRVMRAVDRMSDRHRLWIHIRSISLRAAAIMLPLFIALTAYLYHISSDVKAVAMTVSTGAGERTTVTLPDGTKVLLNSSSQLTYSAGDFSGGNRRVKFRGEAYFDVAKASGRTFVVDGRGYKVTVLGTRFNVNSYADSNVTVSLDEGSVLLSSIQNRRSVKMKPGDVASLNLQTGIITAVGQACGESSAWKQQEIIVRRKSLSDVLAILSRCYGVTFRVSPSVRTVDTFTGVLPTDNINEALDILEQLYPLHVEIEGRQVIVDNR